MKKNSDGIFKDWGEVLEPSKVKGGKGKNIRGGKINQSSSKQRTGGGGREKLERTVNNAPEVMVKISGGGKNMKHIQAHMDYISRNGDIEVEDENGHIHTGKDEVNEIADSWANGRVTIPWKSEKRKEAFNIILSMPPGTDSDSVKNAAREFAKAQFIDHQYLFAAHNDENHPHVHLTVKATSDHGVRLNPRKADLQHWREQFAEKLRDNGIEANATPRRFRGVVKKRQKQAIKHIDNDYKAGKRKERSRATQAQIHTAKTEMEVDLKTLVETGETHINPAEQKIKEGRVKTQNSYGEIAKALASGDKEDKKLALDIVRFVQEIPPLITKHQELVKSINSGGRDADNEITKTKEQSKSNAQSKNIPGGDIER